MCTACPAYHNLCDLITVAVLGSAVRFTKLYLVCKYFVQNTYLSRLKENMS